VETEELADISATTTDPGKNRFRVPLFLRVLSNRTLRPVKSKSASNYVVVLTFEYPTYEEELEAKKACTNFDEFHSLHFVDHDRLSEWRVRRCLVAWDLHKKVKGLTIKLHRIANQLEDESMAAYKRLPPLIRKAIINKLWESMGTP